MNLKNLHTENKDVQINVLFEPKEKVIAMQIAKDGIFKEHFTKVPALLVCVSGNAVFNYENGTVINLKSGNYVFIEVNVKHWINAIEESNFLLIK